MVGVVGVVGVVETVAGSEQVRTTPAEIIQARTSV